jgi:hypothetical protein
VWVWKALLAREKPLKRRMAEYGKSHVLDHVIVQEAV